MASAPGPEAVTPRSLRQAGPRELEITWGDGHVSVYPVAELRRACPCAGCVDEMTGARTLRTEDVPDEVRPVRLEPVGRYAVGIHWSDGHSTGIYTFELLRALCPCPVCSASDSTPDSAHNSAPDVAPEGV